MKNTVKILITFLVITVMSFSIYAQDTEVDMNAPIPMDSDIRYGKLDNGMTYYIRKNETPRERGQFWLIVDAGATLEDDDQDGLAHFCEHMAFNGTKHFPKKGVLDAMESIGVKFGHNVNAFTSRDLTNYMLQKVPTTDEANIDTALLILYDWASNVSYENEEIDNERGVLHEEWRSRRSANFRLSLQTLPVILKDSRYAERSVIGDIDIIDNCSYETLKRFYNDWYRPDLQAVIAIGDFDVDLIEKKIKERFSDIPKRENPRERKTFEVPDHDETYVVVAKDKEARYTSVQIYYKHPVDEEKTKPEYFRKSLKKQLYNMMINERLGEFRYEEFPPFLVAFSSYGGLVPTKDAYRAVAYLKNNEIDRGFKTLVEENLRLKAHGFVESELERNKRVFLKQLDKMYKERYKRKSLEYCWEYFGHFLEDDPIPGLEYEYALYQKLIPTITLEEMNELAPQWITDKNRVVVFTGPDKPEVKLPTEEKVLRILNSVKPESLEPYVDKVSAKPLVSKDDMPASSKVGDKGEIPEYETTVWTLKNGIKVVLKSTDFKDDEILFSAFSPGGSSLVGDRDIVSASIADQVIDNSGLGSMSQVELEKKLADKVLSISPYISELEEGLTGSTSPGDIETFMQLIYLYFTQPRKDNKAYSSFYNRQIGWIENRSNDPATALRDTFQVTMSQHHIRRRPWDKELLSEASFNRAHYIYRDRFADAGDFTFVFVGNLDLKKMKNLVETYIGGLPVLNRNENWKDLNINAPTGVVERTVYQEMETPKATIYITFHGDCKYNLENRLSLNVLSNILDLRYTEEIREKEGGTYGVSVWSNVSHYPKERFTFGVYFECDPENADKLTQIVFDEIKKINTEGPTEKDLNKVKENKLKQRKEDIRENRFWRSVLKSYYVHKEPATSIKDYEEKVQSLSKESIKASSSLLDFNNYVKVILLPKESK